METLSHIHQKIAKAKAQSPLAAHNITLLGASKGQPAERLLPYIEAGLTDFGENRVQEAESKWSNLRKKHPKVRLHLIGPLQTNKVRQALALFDVIQTLDRVKLAEAIARVQDSGFRIQGRSADRPSPERASSQGQQTEREATKEFYIQVNTGEEPQKAGVAPSEAADFISYCRLLGLNVVGLMCVPPADVQPAPHFALLRKIALDNGLSQLSMGMSGDYETAVRMGSTCVRIGTALFGERR